MSDDDNGEYEVELRDGTVAKLVHAQVAPIALSHGVPHRSAVPVMFFELSQESSAEGGLRVNFGIALDTPLDARLLLLDIGIKELTRYRSQIEANKFTPPNPS